MHVIREMRYLPYLLLYIRFLFVIYSRLISEIFLSIIFSRREN